MANSDDHQFKETVVQKFGVFAKAIEESAQKIAEIEEDRRYEKEKATRLEAIELVYNKTQAYTNFVIVAGYAAVFTVWAKTQQNLSPSQNIWIGLLLLLSVSSFVLFEVIKTTWSSSYAVKLQQLRYKELSASAFLEAHNALEHKQGKTSARIDKFWLPVLAFTVLSGLCALTILIVSYAGLLAEPFAKECTRDPDLLLCFFAS